MSVPADKTAYAVQAALPLPDDKVWQEGAQHLTVIDMWVDVSDVLARAKADTYAIEIYADTATLSADTPLAGGRGVVVIARRFVLGGKLTFADDQGTFGWLSREVEGDLSVAGPGGDPASVSQTGAYLGWSGGLQVSPNNTPDAGMLKAGTSLYRFANTAFLIATALFNRDPALSSAMAGWVAWLGAQAAGWGTFGHDAAVLVSMRAAQPVGGLYVPQLDMGVYAATAAGWVSPVVSCEAQWRRMVDSSRQFEERIQAARDMLAYYQDRTTAWGEMIGRAQKELDDANAAWEKAKQRYGGAVLDAQTKKIYFEKFGVPEARLDAEIKMAFQIMTAVVQLAIGIAGVIGGCMVGAPEAGAPMVAGAVEGTATAAEAASSVANAAEASSEAIEDIRLLFQEVESSSGGASSMSKLMEQLKQLGQLSENLKKIGDGVGMLKEGAKTLSEGLDSELDPEKIAGVMDFELPAADPSAATQWEEMARHFDDQIQTSIDMPIKGALEYKMSVDSLALTGRDMTTTGIASLQAAHQLLDLLSQARPDAQMAARVKAQVDAMEQAKTVDAQVQTALYQRYLGLKRPLFAALQQRAWAYQYWALRAPSREPDILDDSVGLQTQLAQAQQDFSDALASFHPPPQPFTNVQITLPDDALAALKATGTATLELGLDEPAFAGLGRVRVSDIQVWLEGVSQQGRSPIRVLISSPGAWRDRYRGSAWSFGGPAWGAEFRYTLSGTAVAWNFSDGSAGYVQMAASVDPSLRANYFYPSAFAAWTLRVPGADLSGLSKVTVVFSGSAISDGGLAAPAVAGPAVTTTGRRRQFSEPYKRAILTEAALCTKRAHLGALLKREGLTGAHLRRWRLEEETGA